MDQDNYTLICGMPSLAKELGVTKSELKRMCSELGKDNRARSKMHKEIEKNKVSYIKPSMQ